MKSQDEINRIFNKFAGQEVKVKEKLIGHKSLESRIETYMSGPGFFEPYVKYKPDWKDPTLLKIRLAAKAHGLKLYLEYPGHYITSRSRAIFGPYAPREDRVCIHLDKSADGKWRVNNKFVIG